MKNANKHKFSQINDNVLQNCFQTKLACIMNDSHKYLSNRNLQELLTKYYPRLLTYWPKLYYKPLTFFSCMIMINALKTP